MIHPLVQDRLGTVRQLCSRHGVRRLELFGSATTPRFDPATSDLDFLVQFQDLKTGGYFDSYFGLLESLEQLFGRPIDLVMAGAVHNPYFLENIQGSRTLLYAA